MNISFKGYAACPLKALYLQGSTNDNHYMTSLKISRELDSIAKEEGFDIYIHSNGKIYHNDSKSKLPPITQKIIKVFAQDSGIFLPNGNIGIFKNGKNLKSGDIEAARTFAKALNRQTKDLSISTEGGNLFIGKKNNGENYILVGDKRIFNDCYPHYSYKILDNWNSASLEKRKQLSQKVIKKLSDETGIKSSNIYLAPQVLSGNPIDFHIDMVLRPLKYPYILVNDPYTVINETKKYIPKNKTQKDEINVLKDVQESYLDDKKLMSTEKIINDLEEQGFKPIRVPGIFWNHTTNYMNAVVHERENGELVYITNASSEEYGADYDKLFENYLKKHVPNIKKVAFIQNYQLLRKKGGLHCVVREEPDFEKWGKSK